MLVGAFGDIVKYIKGKGPDGVQIDNKLFQLHYRLTTFIFLASSGLLCIGSLFGNPVTCHHADPDRISNDVINTYCWVTTTYTLPHLNQRSAQYPNSDIAYHGVGAHSSRDGKRFHTYYQWVPFVLFLQGMLFYLPHWLWKVAEGRRLASLLQEMQVPVMDAGDRKTKVDNLLQYLQHTLGSYNGYFGRYILCELLNVANVVLNFFVIDRFLGGQFVSYGPRVLSFFIRGNGDGASPMTETFPKLTKCNFQLIGGSGTTQTIDSICVMALNILNEKIYLLLWFWLVVLGVASAIAFSWRVVMVSATAMRVPMLRASARLTDSKDLEDVVEGVKLGDFFLISLMAKNMDAVAFQQLMAAFARDITKRPTIAQSNGTAPMAEPSDSQTLIKRAVAHKGVFAE